MTFLFIIKVTQDSQLILIDFVSYVSLGLTISDQLTKKQVSSISFEMYFFLSTQTTLGAFQSSANITLKIAWYPKSDVHYCRIMSVSSRVQFLIDEEKHTIFHSHSCWDYIPFTDKIQIFTDTESDVVELPNTQSVHWFSKAKITRQRSWQNIICRD